MPTKLPQQMTALHPPAHKFKWLLVPLLVALTIYLLLCLSDNAQPLVGKFGVSLRQILGYFFGGGAWVLPLAVMYHLVERYVIPLKYRVYQPGWYYLVGWLLFTFSLSALMSLSGASQLETGVVGFVLVGFSQTYIGSIGSYVLFAATMLVAVGLLICVSWLEIFDLTGKRFLAFFNNRATVKKEPVSVGKVSGALVGNDSGQEGGGNKVTGIEKLVVPAQLKTSNGQKTGLEAKPNQLEGQQKNTIKRARKTQSAMNLPPLALLNSEVQRVSGYSTDELNAMGGKLKDSLESFNIKVTIEHINPGPVVTLFELAPASGVRGSQIVKLAKDLARALSVQSVRIVEAIPGKSFIGVEIPNQQRETVNFYQLLASETYQSKEDPLTLMLGKDIAGQPVAIDLAKTPHLLVAGTTGSGKSVGINSMILSILYKSPPESVKLILIDPKMLEFSVYENIPHLLTPVVTDVRNASAALQWSVAEMERRYKLMSLLGVRKISDLNKKIDVAKEQGTALRDPLYKPTVNAGLGLAEEAPQLEKMPYIVVVIDEFADLMMVVGKQVEELIARLAQKARAAGIHLILATQRPSVNVITGLIKANVPSRLSFQVSTKIDSRTILDRGGAEQLLGLGDMLYLEPGKGEPLRVHGAFVSDAEVHSTVNWLIENYERPEYIDDLSSQAENISSELGLTGSPTEEYDELFEQAWQIINQTGKVSISRVQRELRIGYNRAARLIEEMEAKGLISATDERGGRQILAGGGD